MLIAPLSGSNLPPIQPVPPVRRRPHAIPAPADRLVVGFGSDPAMRPARVGAERQTGPGAFGASPLSAQTAFAVLQAREEEAGQEQAKRLEAPPRPAPDAVTAATSSKAATAAYAQGLQASPGFAFARPADVIDLVA